MNKTILIINPPLKVEKPYVDNPVFSFHVAYTFYLSVKNKFQDKEINFLDAFLLAPPQNLEKSIKIGPSPEDFADQVNNLKWDLLIINFPSFFRASPINFTYFLRFFQALKPIGREIYFSDFYDTSTLYIDYETQNLSAAFSTFGGKQKIFRRDHMPLGINLVNLLEVEQGAGELESDYLAFIQQCLSLDLIKDIKNIGDHTRLFPYLTSIGCPQKCIFCSARATRWQGKSLEQISRDVEYFSHQKIDYLVILDQNCNYQKAHCLGLLKLLKQKRIKAHFANGISLASIDEQLAQHLACSGDFLYISPESGSDKQLKILKKPLSREEIEQKISLLSLSGAKLRAHYILNTPGEEKEDTFQTLDTAWIWYLEYGVLPFFQRFVSLKSLKKCASVNQSDQKTSTKNIFKLFSPAHKSSQPNWISVAYRCFQQKLLLPEHRKLIINVSYCCNNNCIFCSVADRERIDGKLEQQKEHIDQAAQKGITSLDIDGGEPLLYPHLFELIGYARAQGFDRINLTTNGRLLIYNSIVKKLACQPGLSVLVSLHAAQAEVHDQLTRVKGSFDQTLEGLKNAQGVIGNLGVNFTIISKNYQQLPFFINLMQKLGIDIVNIQYYTPFGRKENHLTPPEKAIDQVKTALQMAINSNKIRVNLVNFLPCMAPELAQYMGGDYFKESRYMVFVDNRRVNLARFLGEKRYYGEACAQCAYRCTCRGFWDFGEAGQDSAPKKVRYFTAEEEQPIQRQAATDKMFGKPAMGEKCPPIETKTEISAPGVGSQQVNKIEMLDVIMGYQCNSGCIFCSATDSMRSQNMENSEVMARIKPAMKQLSPTKIRFGGGEPTVRNDLPVLLNAVHKTYPCVSEISIQSNGYRLSYPDYLNSLRDAGLNKVNISIRAHTPTLYQQLTRVPNSMELVEKALINVLAKGLPLELDLLVSKPIVIHLEELCEHYFKLGARNINFWHIAFEGKAVQHPHLIPTLKETSDIINQMLDKYTKSDKIFKVYYIPYCFFPDHQDAVWHPIQENTLVITPANNFRLEKGEIDLGVKTSRCRRCAIEDTCFGIRESYLEMFGDKEIQNE